MSSLPRLSALRHLECKWNFRSSIFFSRALVALAVARPRSLCPSPVCQRKGKEGNYFRRVCLFTILYLGYLLTATWSASLTMNALRVVRSIEASNCNRRSDLQFVAVLSPISQKTDNKLIDAPPMSAVAVSGHRRFDSWFDGWDPFTRPETASGT